MNKLLISFLLAVSFIGANARVVDTSISLTKGAKEFNEKNPITKKDDAFFHAQKTLETQKSKCTNEVIKDVSKKYIFRLHDEWRDYRFVDKDKRMEEYRKLIMFFSEGTSIEQYEALTYQHKVNQLAYTNIYFANSTLIYPNHFDDLSVMERQMTVSTVAPLTLVCQSVIRFRGKFLQMRYNVNREIDSDSSMILVDGPAIRNDLFEIFDQKYVTSHHVKTHDGYPSIYAMIDNLGGFKSEVQHLQTP